MVSSDEIKRRLDAKRRGENLSEKNKVDEGTVNCPECQTPNLENAKFCVGCGKPLPKEETSTVPPVKSTEETKESSDSSVSGDNKETESKVCPSCNQKNKLNAKFCIICGHKFEGEIEEEAIETETVIEDENVTASPEVAESSPEKDISSEETVEPSLDELEHQTTETDESPVVPEIKVPEHLKSDEQTSVPESEHEDFETKESFKPAEVSGTSQSFKSANVTETAESHEEDIQDVDPVEKIKKAKELLDIGAITQEDFDKIKNKYLEQI